MPVPDRQLRVVLGALCALSAAALFRQVVVPPWPRASMPSASTLPLPAGYQPQERGQRAGERRPDWARSRTLRIDLVPIGASAGAVPGETLQLDLARLVARRHAGLQVAELTRSDRALSLQDRRLVRGKGGELALGRIDHDPALQACVVPGGQTGITAHTLGQISGPPPRDALDKLQRLLGLRPHRSYECVLVSLRGTSKLAGHGRLLEVWAQWR